MSSGIIKLATKMSKGISSKKMNTWDMISENEFDIPHQMNS